MPGSTVLKRVLYFAPRPAIWQDFRGSLAELTDCVVEDSSDGTVVACSRTAFHFIVCHDIPSALEIIHREFFILVLLDLREPLHLRERDAGTFVRGLDLLDRMDQEPDIEYRYGFHRIAVLLSGEDTPVKRRCDGRILGIVVVSIPALLNTRACPAQVAYRSLSTGAG